MLPFRRAVHFFWLSPHKSDPSVVAREMLPQLGEQCCLGCPLGLTEDARYLHVRLCKC